MHLVFNTSYSWLIKLFRKAHKDVKLCLQLLCQHLTPMMALSIFMATSRIFWSSSGTPSRAMDVLWKSRCWRTVYTISGSPVLTASCKTGRHKSEIWPPCILTLSDKFQSHYEKYLTGSKANILFKVGPRLQPPRSLWPWLLTSSPYLTEKRREHSTLSLLSKPYHRSLSPLSYHWLWNTDSVFRAGFHCVIT